MIEVKGPSSSQREEQPSAASATKAFADVMNALNKAAKIESSYAEKPADDEESVFVDDIGFTKF